MSLRAPTAVDAAGREGFEVAIEACQNLYFVERNAHGRLARALETANAAVAPD